MISGNTRSCKNLIKCSKDVDLLIHEVASGPLNMDLPPSQSCLLVRARTVPEEIFVD